MNNDIQGQATYQHHLKDGGEMGERIRNYDWSKTPIGTPGHWPLTLLSTLSLILNSRFPMFLWWGPELIQFYNDAYRPSLGNTGKHPAALGQRGEECWPEIWEAIKPKIDQVINEGKATYDEDQYLPIYRNNRLEDVYWTYSYSAVKDAEGKAAGILVICNETTEKVNTYNALKEAKREVEEAQAETILQRDSLKRFFMQAPAGVCILGGPELVYELVNPSFQQFFPGRQLLGKPVFEAIPEIRNQPVAKILTDVYHNDETFEGIGLNVPMARTDNGPIEDRYFNFIYQPRHNAAGAVDGIMVFAFEVTEMMATKKALEKEQDKLRLAITAAELGTFDMDLEKGTMEWDARCRILFGISHNDTVSYEHDFVNGLHPDDRDRIVNIINNVFVKSISNGDYDVEYRTLGAEDKKLRWVRAKGKAYFDENDKPVRFTGSVLEITEQKQDELRKNDFIGMVSHELKTPLTSLKAYSQMLHSRAIKQDDRFSADALAKVGKQVKKMSSMINGFLDLSRLESGKIHLEKQEIELEKLLEEVIEETKLTVSSHKIKLVPCDPVTVFADPDKIGAVVFNLLNNAIKYSDEGKEIQLKCRVKGKVAEVSVKDFGMGIKPEDKEKLFDRFYRAETKQNRYISGFGIGLYLSAEIIYRHGGQIGVESEYGQGSTFYFVLPLER